LLSTVNQGRKALMITITTDTNPKILAFDIAVLSGSRRAMLF
jgi:hypothetical protein